MTALCACALKTKVNVVVLANLQVFGFKLYSRLP